MMRLWFRLWPRDLQISFKMPFTWD
jgi:hypothetical protein